jgi:two-component system, LuxR family, sensor kinase FixL
MQLNRKGCSRDTARRRQNQIGAIGVLVESWTLVMNWPWPIGPRANMTSAGSSIRSYGVAFGSVAIMTEARLLLDPLLGNGNPYAMLFFAIVVTACYGVGPALTAVVLGAFAADYFFLPPRGSFMLEGLTAKVGMLLYLGVGIGISLLGGAMSTALQISEAGARLAREQAALFEKTYDAVLVWDWDGPITLWNKSAEKLYGFSQAEALGRISHDLLRTRLPGGVNSFMEQLQAAGSWEAEFEHVTRDGRVIIVDSRMTLVRDGARAYVIEVNRDISDRRRAQELLEEANLCLEARVDRRTSELQMANADIENFAYAASHDLKAPLRVIDNAAQWLEEDLQAHLTGENRENMTLLRSRVKRMEKLLDDMLDYSRIGRSTDKQYFEVVTGTELMDNILTMIAPPAGFTVKVSPVFAEVRAHRMPLQQILMNLIGNAIKHHDSNQGQIEVTLEDGGAHHVFTVKDDGPGIPAQFHAQVFKLFETLKPKDQVEGSGMGLAMVRRNVEVGGGTLHLESSEGNGSTFRFTLPKQPIDRQAARA